MLFFPHMTCAEEESAAVEPPTSLEQLAQVWNALDANYRLSIAYRIHIVTIDSATGITEAKRVVDAHTAVGYKQG